MIKKILQQILSEQSLVGIQTTQIEFGEVIVGYITDIKENDFIINEIDEYGKPIGSTVIQLSDILHIEYDDRYQKRLKLITENYSSFNFDKRNTIWKDGEKLLNYLDKIKHNKILCTLFLNEDDYVIGNVIEFNNQYILIQNIGQEGDEDGYSCYLLSNFIGIRYESEFEQKIKLLYDNRATFSTPTPADL